MLIPITLLVAGLLMVETPDTLQTVTVIAERGAGASMTDTLSVKSSQTITEFLLQSPGINIVDNGGYAGLKTVSIRGMGSPHTAIYIDGVRVGNVQSGQCDLGSMDLNNFSSTVIDYTRNSLSFITAHPSFIGGRKVGGHTRFSAGSFGTYLPSARIDCRFSDKLTFSANAGAVLSQGKFPYGNSQVRENNDLRQLRGGFDLFGTIIDGDWHAKAWYNGSDRGTPGSIFWPSADRQKDKNLLAQGLVNKQFSTLYHLSASAKVSYDDIFYSSSWGDSRYGQTEAQINTSHKFNICNCLTLSAAADFCWDALNSTVYDQIRFGTTETVSATFTVRNFIADVAVQYDGVLDKGYQGRDCVSPLLDAKLTLSDNFDIAAFTRRAYRVPTFNELYYEGYGNSELMPEDAWLNDLRIGWKGLSGSWKMKAKIDVFCNYLRNKISSAPSPEDPNLWLPYNTGRVRSAGADIIAGFDRSDCGWDISFSAKYGYQNAVDKTPDSDTFGQQIPYIANHSLSLYASASVRGWSAETTWNMRAGRRDSYGEMPDWNTLDINFLKSFNLGKAGIPSLKLVLKNITDKRFELCSGYPMPGFSVTAGIDYQF